MDLLKFFQKAFSMACPSIIIYKVVHYLPVDVCLFVGLSVCVFVCLSVCPFSSFFQFM